ncbi:methyltransferase family protein [Tamaricihabitans halophyticus]|uniref:Methyltransferase family protein n=1 Tax=Tamaricihabitans halophyticus TaxID=1262583 RepID=A0A4V2STT3_9PSEU|nr:class I SAM-dependent methyltransferase [Tamaricihabitans halophyticus]TCP51946.1 methyltransferase family protein [Tamaricihabitans halophyticus]
MPGALGRLRAGGVRKKDVLPSPNIWHWPEVYELENEAQDVHGAIWDAVRQECDWGALDVVDVGCGDGYHLPRFASTANSVMGVEPHEPLLRRARERIAGLPGVAVLAGSAQRLPLPDSSADLVHARTAYFFGPGCEPGIAEAERVLRPGGALVIVDLDGSHEPYGRWLRADLPSYDPAEIDQFFAGAGFSCRRVVARWRFADVAGLRAVLGIEFSKTVATRAFHELDGLEFDVGYRVHMRRKPTSLLPGRS